MLAIVLVVYFVIGCGACASLFASRQRHGALEGSVGIALMLVFWPFHFPVAFLADTRAASSTRSARLNRLSTQLGEAWSDDDRARAVVDRYVDRLAESEARLSELERAVDDAPERVRAQLQTLHARLRAQVDGGLELLEELQAQLLLLRYTRGSTEEPEEARSGVEDLLERMAVLTAL